jgi:hypothetical protein
LINRGRQGTAFFSQLVLFRKEQVLAPLVFAASKQPHQMPAGVQAEGAWQTQELHACFFGRPVSFSVVTRMAAGY